jgi:hypothetical protein
VAALAGGFVLVGADRLDLGPEEARLGLASGAEVGPFGQVFGGWEPGLWPVPVALGSAWAWAAGGWPTSSAVRWPAALAGVGVGVILARRMAAAMGPRAAVALALCWFGSLALIDHSSMVGADLVAGLAVVAALDRILGRGSDWIAGLWTAVAFLGGGWPPLAILALATVVIGRPGSGLSAKLVVPAVAAFAGWSAWALVVAPEEAWGAALALPLTQKPAWGLLLKVLALGLPWSPLATVALAKSVREGISAPGRLLVSGWFQVAGASLVAGTLVPGLASAATWPALAGLAVGAAAVCDRAWEGRLANAPRRGVLAIGLALTPVWALIATLQGGYLAAAVSYYRPISLGIIALAVATAIIALEAARAGQARWMLGAVAAVALGLKLAHWGIYAPEWNYRFSQGPWGRAVGQWVPPNWTLYTTHAWSPDLAFATERPVRQLADPHLLQYEIHGLPRFVLLLDSEFEHWPDSAPKLIKVRAFEDEHGQGRVLARTEGDLTLLKPDDRE